jgi:hypothetical protein
MKTQSQMYYEAKAKNAELDAIFMDMVNDGMTKKELQTLINKRPEVYGVFSNWLEKLK